MRYNKKSQSCTMYDTTQGLFFTVLPFGKFHIFLIEHSRRGVRDIKSGSQPPIPQSSICSFHENGNVVFNLVSESVQGAFPAKTASTIGGASNASRKDFLKNRFNHTAKICSLN